MKRRTIFFTSTLVVGLGTSAALALTGTPPPRSIEWDDLSMTFEINSTDVDSGMLFHVDTGEHIAMLQVTDPSGKVVHEARTDDPQQLGTTCLVWESAEPDLASALLSWPDGPYTVTGMAFDGTLVCGVAEVSHVIPGWPRILKPIDGDVLSMNNVVLVWKADDSAESYWLEVDDPNFDNSYTIPLLPGANTFKMPKQLLQPNTDYKVTVGAIHDNGNVTTTSVEFMTLP